MIRAAAPLVLIAVSSAAWAGPPYVTDDPQPTDLHHWEIYAFGAAEGAHRSWDGAAGLDLNYGAVPGVQLTATLPLDFVHDAGRTSTHGGDIELGVKYRFLHREAAGVDVAIFPRLILPTAGHRFGTGRAQVLLPVWAEKDSGPWSLFGGGGYTINPGAGNRDFWQGGIALTREVSSRLSIGGEATFDGPDPSALMRLRVWALAESISSAARSRCWYRAARRTSITGRTSGAAMRLWGSISERRKHDGKRRDAEQGPGCHARLLDHQDSGDDPG